MVSEGSKKGEYTPKVSVIIPIYNVEDYIEECLDSVMNQTLREIEILCVNDGTPDRSMEIVYEKAGLDKRICIIEKENAGLSAARNAGLKQALGEYVIFLDSDDALKENALEILYGKMVTKDLQQIFFEATVIYDTPKIKRKNYRKYHKYYHRKGDYPQVVTGREMLIRLVGNKEYRMSACLQMFERQFLVQNGLYFMEGILHEDNLFTPQVMMKAARVMVIKEPLYIRRLRKASIMLTEHSGKSSWSYFICYRELKKLREAHTLESEVGKCLEGIVEQTLKQAVVVVANRKKELVLQELENTYSRDELAAYEENVWNSVVMQKQLKLCTRFKYKIMDLIR